MMNVLGVTGITAYFGLLDVGALRAGDVCCRVGRGGSDGFGGRSNRESQ